MLHFRPTARKHDVGLGPMRLCSLTALAAYPAGSLTLAWNDSAATSIVGFGLILVSLISVMVVMAASLQSIVGEKPSELDEYQLKLRWRAMSAAYTCLSTLVLVAVIYAAVASDKGWWLPASYDEYNGLFWGAFLYASMLPGAFLAWQVDPADARAEA